MMTLLISSKPANWDETMQTGWKFHLTQLVNEYGEARTRRAVEDFIKRESFLDLAKLRQYVPSAERQRNYCPRCEIREGFIYVMVDGEPRARAFKCIHDEPHAYRTVSIGPSSDRKTVRAMDADYVEAQ